MGNRAQMGAGVLLAMVAVLAGPRPDASAAGPGATVELAAGNVLHVEAAIDGRSRLILKGDTAQWDHLAFTAPGLHETANAPTLLNKLEWMPKWTNAKSDNWDPDFSGVVRGVRPALPASPVRVTVKETEARGLVTIAQQPAAANDYTLIVDFDDGPLGGSASYAVDLTYTALEKDPPPATPRSVDPALLRDGLVGEFLFAGNARDTSDRQLVAEVHNATLTADRAGHANSAYQFDGKDSWIGIANPPKFDGDGLTIACWVRYDTPGTANWSNALINQDNGRDRRAWQLSTCGRHICWHRMMDGSDLMSLKPIAPGEWHFIACTFDGLEHRLYIDGQLDDMREGQLVPHDDEPIYIGRKDSDEKEFYFTGALDDVRLYRRALTADEVAALYKLK